MNTYKRCISGGGLKYVLRPMLAVVAMALVWGCAMRKRPHYELNVGGYKWTMPMPQGFTPKSKQEWSKVQQQGKRALEDASGKELDNKLKTLFVLKDQHNSYMEANTEPIKGTADQYYRDLEYTYNMMYKGMRMQAEHATLDTTKQIEEIDGLEFRKFTMSSNNTTKKIIIYSRVFGDKALTVSIMFADWLKGDDMLQAFRRSRFVKI